MGSTKEEQERVKNLLLDTVTLLCKNGLNFKQQLKVQGLLGITLDDENVFIVHIDEKVGEAVVEKKDQEESSDQSSIDSRRSSRDSQLTPNKNRKRQADSSPVFRGPPDKMRVKMEKEESNEDLILIDNNVDDKSLIKAQIYQQQQQQQANMPSISNIQGGYPHFNPQNTGQQPPGPYVAANTQHGLTQINTPGGTPEKLYPMLDPILDLDVSLRQRSQRGGGKLVCEIPGCGKAYYDKKNLRRHEKEKHNLHRQSNRNTFPRTTLGGDYMDINTYDNNDQMSSVFPNTHNSSISDDMNHSVDLDIEQNQKAEDTVIQFINDDQDFVNKEGNTDLETSDL